MNAQVYDFDAIRTAVELLERISPEARLLALQNLCKNNGVWTIPERTEIYSPVLFEILLHRVPAVSNDPDELPSNWLKAAHTILKEAPVCPPCNQDCSQGRNCPARNTAKVA